jgi:hypothetical protein
MYYLDSCDTIEKKMLFCEKTRGWVRGKYNNNIIISIYS